MFFRTMTTVRVPGFGYSTKYFSIGPFESLRKVAEFKKMWEGENSVSNTKIAFTFADESDVEEPLLLPEHFADCKDRHQFFDKIKEVKVHKPQ